MHAKNGSGGGIPVLGQLSVISRIALLATVAISIVTIVLDFGLHVEGTVIFGLASVSILGLAWVTGLGTERLGAISGPQIGGIVNAAFGNIAELAISFFALQAGLIEVVKASITGAIIGNLLFVLGASLLLGGMKNGVQVFDRRVAGSNAALLALAAIALFVPAVFSATVQGQSPDRVRDESIFIALVLIAGYVLALIYQLKNPAETLEGSGPAEAHGGPAWTAPIAIGVLVGSAALLAVLSEILVSSIEPFVEAFGLTPFFVGVIVIPTVGNLAEHLVGVQLAVKNRMEFSMAVAFGSTLQVALFVAPILVLLGFVVGQPMNFAFAPLEVAAVAVAVAITTLIAFDGESNWLEGALLVGVYLILAISFFEFV